MWNEGCTDSARLHTELRARGYQGSQRTIRRWLEPLRTSPAPTPQTSGTPSVRQVTGWLTRHPEALTSGEALQLNHILARCPELTAADQVRAFARMMHEHDGQHLPEWITTTEQVDLQPLRSFARNLRNDQAVITAGLTLRWNSGPVEGHVEPREVPQTPDVRPREPRPPPTPDHPLHVTHRHCVPRCGSEPFALAAVTLVHTFAACGRAGDTTVPDPAAPASSAKNTAATAADTTRSTPVIGFPPRTSRRSS